MPRQYSEKRRALVRKLADEHLTAGAIAKRAGVAKSTVQRWLKDHSPAATGLADLPGEAGEEPANDPEPAATPPAEARAPAPPPPVEAGEPVRNGFHDPEPDPVEPPASWEPELPPVHLEGFTVRSPADKPDDDLDDDQDPVAGELVVVSTAEARAVVLQVSRVLDRRLQRNGADAVQDDEHAAVADVWAPIVAKWLSGPYAPVIAASIVTAGVYAPRFGQAMANKKARQGKPEHAEKPAPEPVSADTREELLRRLGGHGS